MGCILEAPGVDFGGSSDDFEEILGEMKLCDCSFESQCRIQIVGELGSAAHTVDPKCFGTISTWVRILLWGEAERSSRGLRRGI